MAEENPSAAIQDIDSTWLPTFCAAIAASPHPEIILAIHMEIKVKIIC